MRISDWSSDVCSSDLADVEPGDGAGDEAAVAMPGDQHGEAPARTLRLRHHQQPAVPEADDSGFPRRDDAVADIDVHPVPAIGGVDQPDIPRRRPGDHSLAGRAREQQLAEYHRRLDEHTSELQSLMRIP